MTTAPSTISNRVQSRMAHPLFAGLLTDAEASARNCTLVRSSHGVEGTPQHVELGLLVDASGTVRDARVRSGAGDVMVAAFDVMAELAVGRRLDDLKGITPRLVDAKLREPGGGAVLNLSLDPDQPFYVLVKAAERGAPATGAGSSADTLPWSDIGLFEKVRRIEAVLDQHVRPALANDGGGIDLVDLNNEELSVQYQGACGSCGSSVGGTLQFVQDSLNNHLNTSLTLKVIGLEEGMFPV